MVSHYDCVTESITEIHYNLIHLILAGRASGCFVRADHKTRRVRGTTVETEALTILHHQGPLRHGVGIADHLDALFWNIETRSNAIFRCQIYYRRLRVDLHETHALQVAVRLVTANTQKKLGRVNQFWWRIVKGSLARCRMGYNLAVVIDDVEDGRQIALCIKHPMLPRGVAYVVEKGDVIVEALGDWKLEHHPHDGLHVADFPRQVLRLMLLRMHLPHWHVTAQESHDRARRVHLPRHLAPHLQQPFGLRSYSVHDLPVQVVGRPKTLLNIGDERFFCGFGHPLETRGNGGIATSAHGGQSCVSLFIASSASLGVRPYAGRLLFYDRAYVLDGYQCAGIIYCLHIHSFYETIAIPSSDPL